MGIMSWLFGAADSGACSGNGSSPTRPGGGRGTPAVAGLEEAYERAASTEWTVQLPECALRNASPDQIARMRDLDRRCQDHDLLAAVLAICDGNGDREICTARGRRITAAELVGTQSPTAILRRLGPESLRDYARHWETYVTSGECARRGR